jgi:hypothetical protein
MMKKLKLTTIIFAICCVSFLALLAFNPSHAYFQIFTDPVGINTAKVDLLFDKFTPNQEVEGDTTTRGNYTYGSFSGNIYTDAWGTIKNPYVMTGKNHVNNLFILQKSGYFEKKVDENNKPRQSYFVVSTKSGTPIVIDCGGMNINPIGTPAKPFTGNIQGAPLTGEATYTAGAGTSATPYTVTQSTIANLNVIASESTPDIGFFGTLGFKGTSVDYIPPDDDVADDITGTPGTLTGGFAASISNVLFADISISTTQSVTNDWWTTLFKDHTHYTDHGETHHVGIVAGHAEWATIKDVSVYYSSDSIKAFSLGGTSTNYYSVCGIIGTLKYVNPTATSTGFNTENSVSDDTLELTGGGGGFSGMLTGYMLSEKIFGRNTNTGTGVGTENLEDIYDIGYDVKDLKEGSNSIFEYVDVTESNWLESLFGGERTYRYYFFRDSIFTFAMSARGQVTNGNVTDSDGKVDYLVKVWDLKNDGSGAPIIKLADSLETGTGGDWTQIEDTNKSQVLYKLQATTTLNNNDQYILAYRRSDGTIYTFDVKGTQTGYVNSFTLDPIEVISETGTSKIYSTEYFTDGNNYKLYNANHQDTGFRTPKIDGVVLDSVGYLLYQGTEDANGNVTYSDAPLSAQTGTYMYFKDLGNGIFETTYVDTADSNKIKTQVISQRMVAEDEDGNSVTYVFRAEKVYLGLKSIFVVDNAYSVPKKSYYFSKGLKYVTDRPLTEINPENTSNNSLGVTINGNDLTKLSPIVSTIKAEQYPVWDSWWSGTERQDAYWYSFSIGTTGTTENPALATVKGTSYFINDPDGDAKSYIHFSSQLSFDGEEFSLKIGTPSETTSTTAPTNLAQPEVTNGNFLLFKVVKVDDTHDTVVVPGKNWTVSSSIAEFDASTHVLFFDGDYAHPSYTITPLAHLKWNNGNGEYLSRLNHAIRLAEATKDSQKLDFQKLLGDNLLGNIAQALLGSNSGGTVPAPIGTNGTAYTIPAGMIAFDILKASADEPSYINIIVAVNPEQNPADNFIGIYGPRDVNNWRDEFKLSTNYKQRFKLPVSMTGTYPSYLEKYYTTISGYYTQQDGKYVKTSAEDGPFYAYLGGEVTYVAYTFSITEPGVYLLGSSSGPMTVAYFSVDGAAGAGNDGAGNLPLGFVDFVYDNGAETNPTILTVDKHQSGAHVVEAEDLNTYYYPSYQYVRLIPNANYSDTDTTDTINGKIPIEEIYVRRYIGTANADTGIKRHLSMKRKDGDTTFMIVSSIYADNTTLTLSPNQTQ